MWLPKMMLVLVHICAIVTQGFSGVVPTQDTLVVTKTDVESSSPKTEQTDMSTESAIPRIKLTEMDVTSEVTMRYSHTTMVAHMRNPAKISQEAIFRVLLPETAFISGFEMALDGKVYKAYVKEKEEAKKIYNDAVSQGIGAAHVATKARDSNQFTVSVNIEPSSSAIFNLTYEELLIRRNGVYNLDINLHPGSLVPKLTVTVHIKETQKISILRVPEMRTGNEVDATEKDIQNSQAVINKSKNDREVTVVFKPDLDEQKRLMEVYTKKTQGSLVKNRKSSKSNKSEEVSLIGVLGQFVVQYDVERTTEGEILVNNGYFVHFYAPTSLPPLNKHVIFVLDTSGSMTDRKIEQVRQAMRVILNELNKGDYFHIVEFASSVKVHDMKEADAEPVRPLGKLYYEKDGKVPLLPPSQATPENLAKAMILVSRMEAVGGTNIAAALDVAVELVHKGINWNVANVTSINASSCSNDNLTTKVPCNKQDNKEPKEEEALDKDNKIESNQVEPIIIFLTDGDATVGETDPRKIVNRVTELNYGNNNATIFSLAFGDDADHKLLRKLSLRNNGFMRHIYEASDAAIQLHNFYRQVSSPLLSHVKFVYPPEQVKEKTVTKTKFRAVYAGSETVVAGQIDESTTDIVPEVLAFCGTEDGVGRKKYSIRPKVSVLHKTDVEYKPLERLWAYLTIKQLFDERDADERADKIKDKEHGPEKRALALALKYNFVTELTSLVVVKPNATKAVDAESVDKTEPHHNSAGVVPGAIRFSSAGPSGLPAAKPEAFGPNFSAHKSSFMFDSDSQPQYEIAEEEEDEDPIDGTFPKVSPPQDLSALAVYQLELYPWAEDVLEETSDELVIDVNGTNVHLKLTTDDSIPKSSTGDEDCAKATDGSPGVCVYLPRCNAARDITVVLYTTIYCIVDNEYAGVCCPRAGVQ